MPFNEKPRPVIEERIKKIAEKKDPKMSDYRMKSIAILLSSGMFGAVGATALAKMMAEGGDVLLNYVLFQVDGIEESKKAEELKGVMNRIEEINAERQRLGPARSAIKRFFENRKNRKNTGGDATEKSFVKDTLPFLKMKKMWLEATAIGRDVLYWNSFLTWWITFFSLITSVLFKYRNGVLLKKEQISLSKDGKNMSASILDLSEENEEMKDTIIQLESDLRSFQYVMVCALDELSKKGSISQQTMENIQKVQQAAQPLIDDMQEQNLVELSSWDETKDDDMRKKIESGLSDSLMERLDKVKNQNN